MKSHVRVTLQEFVVPQKKHDNKKRHTTDLRLT